MRNIFVPQTGHLPWVAGLPFFMVIWAGSAISLLVLHFTQYASDILSTSYLSPSLFLKQSCFQFGLLVSCPPLQQPHLPVGMAVVIVRNYLFGSISILCPDMVQLSPDCRCYCNKIIHDTTSSLLLRLLHLPDKFLTDIRSQFLGFSGYLLGSCLI